MEELLKKEIQDLKRELQDLKSEVFNFSHLNNSKSKDGFRDLLNEQIADSSWESFIQNILIFSSLTAVGVVGNSPTLLETTMRMTTLATTNNSSGFVTAVPGIGLLKTFDKDMRFRTQFDLTTVATQTIEIGMGGVATTGITGNGFGFSISGEAISGFAQTSAGSRTTINLNKNLSTTNHILEARLYAPSRVDFYVDEDLLGSVTATMPTGTAGITFSGVTIAGQNVVKTSDIVDVEFYQSLI